MKDQILNQIKEDAVLNKVPIMKDDGLTFLLDYVREHESIRDILEIGTAVGYSAISLAKIRWDMRIDTLEIDESRYKQALENISLEKLDDRIHVYLGDAMRFETNQIYDLIFVDAAKSQYRRYTEHFLRNTQIGSVFIYDNLGFHGIVDNPDLTDNRSTLQMTQKIKKFRDHLLQDPRFETIYYDEIGDGVAVAKRIK